MNHPAELALHQYMENAVKGKSSMADDTIKQVASDVAFALKRQFGGGNKRDKFGLRMSASGLFLSYQSWQVGLPTLDIRRPNLSRLFPPPN